MAQAVSGAESLQHVPSQHDEVGRQEPRPKKALGFARKHRLSLLWAALAAVALAIATVYAARYLATFESTDDAQVDGNASTIASRIAGTG